VVSPCAACKILRRRCVEKCVLAPYFPPTDPLKFTIAHRVFGASNIIKFLQVTYIHYSPIKKPLSSLFLTGSNSILQNQLWLWLVRSHSHGMTFSWKNKIK
jgi:hypothetical protein